MARLWITQLICVMYLLFPGSRNLATRHTALPRCFDPPVTSPHVTQAPQAWQVARLRGFVGMAKVLTDENWQALKLASMRGCSDDELSKTFSVTNSCIRMRRSRDAEWKAVVNNPRGVPPGKRYVAKAVALSQKTAQIATAAGQAIALSMETIASESPLMVARFAHEAIGRSIKGEVIPDPSSWKELATAVSMVRTATGLDKAETAVTLNLWSGQPAAQMMRDCGPVESQEA